MSEGELVRQEGGGHQLSYPRSNNTVDNIRELANSPQRGVYMWKDTSPGYSSGGGGGGNSQHQHQDFYRSNPTSPTQQAQPQQQASYGASSRTYHPAMRGGVPVYPPQSPQVHRKNQLAGAVPIVGVSDTRRRPMSFVRALEMSDSVEMTSTNPQQQQCTAGHSSGGRPSTPDRISVYDLNYEISV